MQYGVNFFQKLVEICNELRTELIKIPKELLQVKILEIIPFQDTKGLECDEFIEICCQNVCLLTVYKKIFPDLNLSVSKRFLEQFWSKLFANKEKKVNFFIKKLNVLPIEKVKIDLTRYDSISQFIQTVYTQFIKEYNPNLQKKRGITYTPRFIIRTMIESIDSILQSNFNDSLGIASKDLILYDPATGSLSFEIGLISYVYDQIRTKNKEKDIKFEDWVFQSFNNSFLGNELNPPAYFLGKFLLFDILHQLNNLSQNLGKNFNVFFKSALSPDILEEFKHKNQKTNKPLVIFGNPPYSVSSSNRNSWIYKLMKEYSVKEPNLTRLYDDYVKFLRLGQWLLDQQKSGILAFITNRKYLDGKIFYGMRQSMLKSFDTIHIIDLFGDIRNIKDYGTKTNTNIFNIQTGVCIGFFIKNIEKNEREINKIARIFYMGVKGSIDQIKTQLVKPFEQLPFIELSPHSPKFYFVPIELENDLTEIWNNQCIPITDCFQKTSRAMISSRDRFMINVDKKPLEENIALLKNKEFATLRFNERIGQKFDEILENEDILASFNFNEMESSIIQINYRPFDIRHGIFYTINRKCGKSIILDYLNKPNPNFNSQDVINKNNISYNNSGYAFNFVQSIQHPPFNHFLFTKGVVDSGLFGYSTSKVAPLWIDGKSNITPKFTDIIKDIIPQTDPIQISGYIYAILNCDQFTKIFEPILIHEFPRILIPYNSIFFERMSVLGKKLMHLHVFEFDSIQWEKYRIFYEQISFLPKSFQLKSWKFEPDRDELHIISVKKKDSLKFPCSNLEWNYKIGSIKLLDHWLKARKFKKLGRSLKPDELSRLITLLFVIKESLHIKKQIAQFFSKNWKHFN
ncbi:type ISP restriction/modification enzyme [Promethearchaeum syntrophicum]|uniref:site-specific DNA-methyltransferase (adenine-specific) n=1 Tax=Promethearchaeum syntrophicum TaxID=2594042 RepID=A0A5B9D654_9ARCH|nr:type ISP restriction/modification enzyme [Candidatus Prometheoarchaeum syntrophicum]QEE14618.1 N-6 DNA Methylase [Candidatus Prometheoarchaeum syntrophicum]